MSRRAITRCARTRRGAGNVAAGTAALYRSTGSRNVALGRGAGEDLTTGSDNIDLSNRGVAGESGKIRIGTAGTHTAAFLAGVSGVSIPGPTQSVLVNANGQLGTATASSRALKTDFRPLTSRMPALLGLEPVSYRYKGSRDRQFGLIARTSPASCPTSLSTTRTARRPACTTTSCRRCCSRSPNASSRACIVSRPAPTASGSYANSNVRSASSARRSTANRPASRDQNRRPVEGLRRRARPLRPRSRRSSPARSSASWARTARASRRRCGCCST